MQIIMWQSKFRSIIEHPTLDMVFTLAVEVYTKPEISNG